MERVSAKNRQAKAFGDVHCRRYWHAKQVADWWNTSMLTIMDSTQMYRNIFTQMNRSSAAINRQANSHKHTHTHTHTHTYAHTHTYTHTHTHTHSLFVSLSLSLCLLHTGWQKRKYKSYHIGLDTFSIHRASLINVLALKVKWHIQMCINMYYHKQRNKISLVNLNANTVNNLLTIIHMSICCVSMYFMTAQHCEDIISVEVR